MGSRSVARGTRSLADRVAAPKLPRLTTPMVRDVTPDGSRGELRSATWDEALDRAAAGLSAARDAVRDGSQPNAFGMFSCSKATNEMNYVAQKFARVAMGSNNIDSCNRT